MFVCSQPQFLGVLDHRNGQEGPAEWVSEQDSNRRDYYYETVENAKGGASSYSSMRRQEVDGTGWLNWMLRGTRKKTMTKSTYFLTDVVVMETKTQNERKTRV